MDVNRPEPINRLVTGADKYIGMQITARHRIQEIPIGFAIEKAISHQGVILPNGHSQEHGKIDGVTSSEPDTGGPRIRLTEMSVI